MPKNDEERVTLAHLRAAGFCADGVKSYCERHGHDYRRLIKEGIPLSEMDGVEKIDQPVLRLMKMAKGRNRGN